MEWQYGYMNNRILWITQWCRLNAAQYAKRPCEKINYCRSKNILLKFHNIYFITKNLSNVNLVGTQMPFGAIPLCSLIIAISMEPYKSATGHQRGLGMPIRTEIFLYHNDWYYHRTSFLESSCQGSGGLDRIPAFTGMSIQELSNKKAPLGVTQRGWQWTCRPC